MRRGAVLHAGPARHRHRAGLRPHHQRHRRGDDRLVRHRAALLRDAEGAFGAARPRRRQGRASSPTRSRRMPPISPRATRRRASATTRCRAPGSSSAGATSSTCRSTPRRPRSSTTRPCRPTAPSSRISARCAARNSARCRSPRRSATTPAPGMEEKSKEFLKQGARDLHRRARPAARGGGLDRHCEQRSNPEPRCRAARLRGGARNDARGALPVERRAAIPTGRSSACWRWCCAADRALVVRRAQPAPGRALGISGRRARTGRDRRRRGRCANSSRRPASSPSRRGL